MDKIMKNAVVITSIFPPTEAVYSFSRMEEYKLIVVGDKKTPIDWFCANVDYISVERQEQSNYSLSKVLPYNHYCRKMLGYLQAIELGVEYIVDTDDDNIPKQDWKFPEFNQLFECVNGNKGFVNIYQLFTKQKIWPRGLPLNLINTDFELGQHLKSEVCNVGIWQGLADEDPDVDAIYRLTSDVPCVFNKRPPVVLNKGTICPFNTQNTIIRKELFTLMYLPTYVTFRFTDILRGLVAQPIMWMYNYQLGFVDATVVQKRNPHDYMKDFISEIPMYQYCEKVVELVLKAISSSQSIEDNLFNAYKSLLDSSIVCDEEIQTLEAWLNDLAKYK
jgi:STELLO glycosyltransferases